jgi:drug/metabolite transporter (DMT)-like permease
MNLPLLLIMYLTGLGRSHGFSFGDAIIRCQSQFSSSHHRRGRSVHPSSILDMQAKTVSKFVPLHLVEKSVEESLQGHAALRADKLLGILVLFTVPLSWGTYVPVVRYLYAIQPPVPGFLFSACYYALASVTTLSLAFWQSRKEKADGAETKETKPFPIRGGIELGSYLFIANCFQVIGLQTVESDRAGFLVQLTTVFVPFVEALFAGNLATVPGRTWAACVFAFIGLFVMGLDRQVVSDPLSAFVTALSSFTRGDALIIGAAVLYTLHVVRLGAYAKETTPMNLAASKATAETIFSVLLVGGLASLSSVLGEGSGLLGFASSTGKEIIHFVVAFKAGLTNGSLTLSILLPAIGAVFWTGWITCAYTIYAQSFGQSRVSPTSANLIYTFQPIFTALFGWLLLGETMGASGFVGGAIVASSVYMVASASFTEESMELSKGDRNVLLEVFDSASTGDRISTQNETQTETTSLRS